MNESCHIWKSHVTYERVRSHMKESCHIWRSQMGRAAQMRELCHIWMSRLTYECVMSHMNESCPYGSSSSSQALSKCSCSMSAQMYQHTNGSCDIRVSHVTFEWVMSHMNESCHIWMSHVAYAFSTPPHTTPTKCIIVFKDAHRQKSTSHHVHAILVSNLE